MAEDGKWHKKYKSVMNNITNIETFIVAFIILLQLWIFFRTLKRIKTLAGIFPKRDNLVIQKLYIPAGTLHDTEPKHILQNMEAYTSLPTENQPAFIASDQSAGDTIAEEITAVSIIDTKLYHPGNIFNEISLSINTYLLRNKGAAGDFELVKDIVERNCNAEEESINATIQVPLYLGLMGTMLGIVIGLLNIPDLGAMVSATNVDSELGNGINILLGGVKIAMLASLTGLGLTLLHSALLYRSAKARTEQGKNIFYTFIQTELLPVINQNMGTAMHSLQNTLAKFNDGFGANMQRLNVLMEKNYKSLEMQDNVLTTIQKMDVDKLAKVGISMANQATDVIAKFKRFGNFLDQLNGFTDNSIHLVGKTTELLQRTENFEVIAAAALQSLQQGNKLMQFFNNNITALESSKLSLEETVSKTNIAIGRALEELQASIISKMQAVKDITMKEEALLGKALSESRTGLGNLKYLEEISKKISISTKNSENHADLILNELILIRAESKDSQKNSNPNERKKYKKWINWLLSRPGKTEINDK
jgi:hypothetical protein